MAFPKFYKFIMPVLQHLSQVERASYSDLISHVQNFFNLSKEDVELMLSSQNSTVVYDRVAWAVTYLKQAGLIKRFSRGIYQITELGKTELQKFKNENIHELNIKILTERYPSFRDFKSRSRKKLKEQTESVYGESEKTSQEIEESLDNEETPIEKIESIHLELTEHLKKEMIERIFESSYFFFEKLVVDLLINLGYGGSRKEAGKAFQTTRDEGIDGTIYEDKLGLDLIHIQAKRWKATIGRPEIQKFAGALQGKRVKKGVFITTSSFSKDAKDFVKGLDSKIILIDRDQLTDFMIESNTGVVTDTKYEVKKINDDYFDEIA